MNGSFVTTVDIREAPNLFVHRKSPLDPLQ